MGPKVVTGGVRRGGWRPSSEGSWRGAVGLPRGFGEVPVVGVEIALGGLDRLVPEDLLEDVQGDAGVGHPRRPGVPEAVSGEIPQPESCDEVIPVSRVPHRRGGQDAAAWPAQEWSFDLLPKEPITRQSLALATMRCTGMGQEI